MTDLEFLVKIFRCYAEGLENRQRDDGARVQPEESKLHDLDNLLRKATERVHEQLDAIRRDMETLDGPLADPRG